MVLVINFPVSPKKKLLGSFQVHVPHLDCWATLGDKVLCLQDRHNCKPVGHPHTELVSGLPDHPWFPSRHSAYIRHFNTVTSLALPCSLSKCYCFWLQSILKPLDKILSFLPPNLYICLQASHLTLSCLLPGEGGSLASGLLPSWSPALWLSSRLFVPLCLTPSWRQWTVQSLFLPTGSPFSPLPYG